jgi:DNA-directed RNA polymerase subunit RPC12/RpoP
VLAGQRGEYRRIGVTATSLELVQSGMKLGNGNVILRSLRVTAGPGHPPCARCHHPLEVELDGRLSKSRCPQCGATQSCELPDRASQSCAAVCGVIAEELALDRREAKVDDSTSDAAAIKCAHCAAPLKVTGISSIVTCEYCGASSRIPRRTMFKLGHDHPVTQLWWLAFSRRLAATLAPPPPPAPPPKQRREPAARANERAPSRPPATPKPDGLGVLAALAMVIAVGLLGYHDDLSRWVTALRAAAASPSTPASGSGRAPAAVAGPELSAGAVFVDLAGCRCGTTQLRGQLDRDGGSIRLRAMRETHAPVELERFELGTVHALGLGCERDRIVIAAGSRAAAWSLDRGIKAWDRALPAAFRGDRPGDRDVRCAPLKIARGRITIPTGARGATVVKLINGQR